MSHLPRMLRTIRGERGSMLVLALLVLLALTSIAMVAVQNVNSELRYAGNSRKGAAAYRVTESGAFTSLAYAQALGPSSFVSRVSQAMQDSGAQHGTWQPDDMVTDTAYFDMTATGSFGYEGYLEGGTAQAGAPQPFDFELRVRPTGMRQPLVGYDVSGSESRCRFKYEMDSVGNVGTDTADATYAAWQTIRTLQFIGPLPCDQVVQGTIPDMSP